MADVKRKTFSGQEVKLLWEIYEANKVIIDSKGESHLNGKKKEIWDDMARRVSACGVATRTVKLLRNKVWHLKKWKKAQNKHDVKNTVKGIPPPDNTEQAGGLIGDETCYRLINGFSEAVPRATQQQPPDHSSKKSSADQVKRMIESMQSAAHRSTAHVSNTDKTPPNWRPYNKDCPHSARIDPASNINVPNDSSFYDNNEGMGDSDSEEEDDGNSDDDEDCFLLPDLDSDSHSGSSQHRTLSHTATPPHPSTEALQIKTKVDIDSADSSSQGKGQPSSTVLINKSDQPSPYTLHSSVVNSVSGRQIGRDVSNEDLASSGAEPHSGVAPSLFKSPQRPSSSPRQPSPSTKMPNPSTIPPFTPNPSPNSFSMPKPSPNPPSMPNPSPNPPSMPNPSPNPPSMPNPSPNPPSMPSPSPNPPSMPSPSPNPPSMPSPSPNPPSMPSPSPNPPSMPSPSPNPPSMPSPSPNPPSMPSPSPNPPSMPSPSTNPPSMPSPSPNPPSMPSPSPNPPSMPSPSPNPPSMPSPSTNPPSISNPSPNPPSTKMSNPSSFSVSHPRPRTFPRVAQGLKRKMSVEEDSERKRVPVRGSAPLQGPGACEQGGGHPYRNYGLSVGDRLNELRDRRVIVAVMRDIDLAFHKAEV